MSSVNLHCTWFCGLVLCSVFLDCSFFFFFFFFFLCIARTCKGVMANKLIIIIQIKGKTWEVLSPQDAKVGKNPYFGVISEIQTAKFGVLVTYTFGGKIWGTCHLYFWRQNLGSKFWGQPPPPRPPNMKVPLGLTYLRTEWLYSLLPTCCST